MVDEHRSAGSDLRLDVPGPDEAGGAEPPPADETLASEARAFAVSLLRVESGSGRDPRQMVDELGLQAQQEAAHRSALLAEPLRRCAGEGDEGGPVARTLEDLRSRIGELDPNARDLSGGPLDRLLARLPGIPSALQRYFRRFESAQDALDAIIRDLDAGRERLRRDNLTLGDDQGALRTSIAVLQREIAFCRAADAELERAVADQPEGPDGQRAFIEEELLFPLRQRITDLQQQLAVAQQGVMALEILIRNNRELMRGVDRAIHVTVGALNVAVTVAFALARQRLVLDRIDALNAGTSQLIRGTAQTLRQQGGAIQQRAAGTSLDLNALAEACGDVMAAVDDLARYRRDALPRLQEQIEHLAELTGDGDSALEHLGSAAAVRVHASPGHADRGTTE